MTQSINCSYSIEGSGPALFLIHGIGAARATWKTLLPKLTEHFTTISYDLRGHGTSTIPQQAITLSDLVADLEALRSKLNIEEAHFAGHSLGGMIGPAYAEQYPERVLSLGLLSTAAFRTDDDKLKVQAVVQAMKDQGIAQVLSTLKSRWFTDNFIQENPHIIEARMQQVLATDPEVFLNVFQIYAETEMSPWLHTVTAPCLVLTGENDGGCNPRLNKLIHAALPNSTLKILPDYKHSLLLEAGEDVASAIIQFIQSIQR